MKRSFPVARALTGTRDAAVKPDVGRGILIFISERISRLHSRLGVSVCLTLATCTVLIQLSFTSSYQISRLRRWHVTRLIYLQRNGQIVFLLSKGMHVGR